MFEPSAVNWRSELVIAAGRPNLVRTSSDTAAPPKLELRLKK